MSSSLKDIIQKIDIRDLDALLSVAETGSFRKAAQLLGLGQSAVSRRIQKIEDLLGVSLFERRPSGARLTIAGSELIACAGAVLSNLAVGIVRAQAIGVADQGSLRLGTMSTFSMGPQRSLVKSFIEKHPDTRVTFFEAARRSMMVMLSHRTLDAVITVGAPNPVHGDCLLIERSKVFAAVAESSDLARATAVTWDEVGMHDVLVSAREASPDIQEYIIRRATSFGKNVSIQRHQLCREGIMNLVGLGLGITIVGAHATGTRHPDVRLVPIANDETIPFSLTWRPENDNPALRRFISLARIEAKKNGAAS